MEKGVIECSASGLVAVWTESCRSCPALVEDQTLEVVSEVDRPDLGVGTRKPNGADEQSHVLLLVCEDMFDGCADGRLADVGLRDPPGHWTRGGFLRWIHERLGLDWPANPSLARER